VCEVRKKGREDSEGDTNLWFSSLQKIPNRSLEKLGPVRTRGTIQPAPMNVSIRSKKIGGEWDKLGHRSDQDAGLAHALGILRWRWGIGEGRVLNLGGGD